MTRVVDRMTAEMDIYKSLERYWRTLTQAAQLGRLSDHTFPTTSCSLLETGVPSFLHIKSTPAPAQTLEASENEGDERSTHARHVLRAHQAYLRVSASHYTRALAPEPAIVYWKLLTNAVYGPNAAASRSKAPTTQCGAVPGTADSETASGNPTPRSHAVRGSQSHRANPHAANGRSSYAARAVQANAMDVTDVEAESTNEPTARSGPSSSSSACTAPIASSVDSDSPWSTSEQSNCASPLFTPRGTLSGFAPEHLVAGAATAVGFVETTAVPSPAYHPLRAAPATIDTFAISSTKPPLGLVSPLARPRSEHAPPGSTPMSGVQLATTSATPAHASGRAGSHVATSSAPSSHPTPTPLAVPRSPLSPDDVSITSSRHSLCSRFSRPCSHASSATCVHSTYSDLHASDSNRSWSDIEEKYDPSFSELHAEIESGFQFHTETTAMCSLPLSELVNRFEFAVIYLRGCVTLEWPAFAAHLGRVSESILQCLLITRRPELEDADPELTARIVDSVYLLSNWYARNGRFGALTAILLLVRNLSMDVQLDMHCPLSATRVYIALVWWARSAEQREEFFNWGMRYLPEVVGGDWMLKMAYVNSVVSTEASAVDSEDELWHTCVEFLDSAHTLAHLLDQSETMPQGTTVSYKIYIGVLRAEMSLRVDAGTETAFRHVHYVHKLLANLSDDETLLILQYLQMYLLQTKSLSSNLPLPDGSSIPLNDFLRQQLSTIPTMPLPKQPSINR